MNIQSGRSTAGTWLSRRARSVAVRRGPTRTVRGACPWSGGVVAAACASALDLDGGVVEVDVGPGERERFGDARASADEQFGQWAVVSGAGAQVVVDLSEMEVVELVVLDRKGRDAAAGIVV